ncbi:MAG: BLUF domain-containing protein [Pseudomonadota bacterium]
MHRALYVSDMRLDSMSNDAHEHVAAIVEKAKQSNKAAGVTGALIFVDGVFIQVLEGPLSAIEPVFERICCDTRHANIRLIEFVEADQRLFPDWSMAFHGDTQSTFGHTAASELLAEVNDDKPISAEGVLRHMRRLILTGAWLTHQGNGIGQLLDGYQPTA